MDKSEKEERIRRRAYDLWCAAGWPKGRDQEHWEQARREIEKEMASDEPAAGNPTIAEAGGVSPKGRQAS